ncbi:MAG: hypothetical protein R2851_10535 [Caldilineaceae bacterium]
MNLPRSTHAVGLLRNLLVAQVLDDLLLELGHEAGVDVDHAGHAFDAAIHAEVGVAVAAIHPRRQPLVVPDGQRLVPKAEIQDRRAIPRRVLHGGGEAFAVVHDVVGFLVVRRKRLRNED